MLNNKMDVFAMKFRLSCVNVVSAWERGGISLVQEKKEKISGTGMKSHVASVSMSVKTSKGVIYGEDVKAGAKKFLKWDEIPSLMRYNGEKT